MILVLYQKILTLLKYLHFTKNFVLYQTIRTPDEQKPNYSKGLPMDDIKVINFPSFLEVDYLF